MRKSSNLFLFFTMSCIADPFYGDVTKNRDKVIIENNVLTENITPCALPNTPVHYLIRYQILVCL
ncbi:hypothetical protein RZ66_01590 [[Haemophilus] ducreyi]|nr:hypothetical protein RZ66_01590 [[Haemophilus] ducreyi]